MVVQVVHINSMTVFEPKCHSPVARDGYRMMSSKATLEGMHPESGEVHTLRSSTPIKGSENAPEFRHMIWSDFG